ncbi:MAG: NAD-dependent epimerase/dehydratase family protein [Proteobacteria bacterium]|nr:NAD-dependent epimerase/dehydratase family protein [Pseudomonadota bacterium]
MSPGIRNIAVLGGSRFIGRAIVEALLEKGCRVTTVNRGFTPVRYSGPVQRVLADRRDPAGYAEALADIHVEGVVDVTAYHPLETRVVLDAFRDRLDRFVHISTLSVYRWPFPCLVSEDATLETHPLNAYGFQKAACEGLVIAEPTAHLPWTILRLPPVFGPGDPSSREAYLYRQILGGKSIVVPPRPYQCQNLFVADAARAVCRLIESKKAPGRVYNAGGMPFTLEAYVELLADIAEKQPQMIRAERRVLEQGGADPEKIPYFFEGDLVLDTRRIRDEIGFVPAWTLEKALAVTLKGNSLVPEQGDSHGWGLPWDKTSQNPGKEKPLLQERPLS